MIKNLEKKLKFIELVDEMKMIKRTILKRDNSLENDAEHSYHLAVMVMTFIDDFKELDYEKCLKFALIHDIVEIYAWDTPAFNNKDLEKTKHQREKESFDRLNFEFWKELPEIINLIKDYEEQNSKESRFVYSLDKIQPIIQCVLEWWKKWQEYKLDIEEIKKNKYSKISNEFWLEKVLDVYFERAEKEKICYKK